jgi:spoIIIJ-associated protein
MSEDTAAVVEAEGETVGEAKWVALRELERRFPGLDRDLVEFEVVTEGERGLLGVGTSPARVFARFDPAAQPQRAEPVAHEEGDRAALVREMLEEIAHALGADCSIDVVEADGEIAASMAGPDVAVLIGKHGKTIDSIQYLVGAAVASGSDPGPRVVVDAGGYRERRELRLVQVAERSASEALRSGRIVRLEPMTSAERKIVHEHLKDTAGVETHSEGDEPNRYVVVAPASVD